MNQTHQFQTKRPLILKYRCWKTNSHDSRIITQMMGAYINKFEVLVSHSEVIFNFSLSLPFLLSEFFRASDFILNLTFVSSS
jgi:hypothetical protein